MVTLFGICIAVIYVLWDTADRVERVLGYMSMTSSAEKFYEILATLQRGAEHAEHASESIEATSHMGLHAAQEAIPSLQRSVNETLGMVDRLREFSSHPKLQISV